MNEKLKRILKEVRLWLWVASVIPLSSLAGMFFVWAFGTEDLLHIAMVTGATSMFTIAVVWWFWALHTIKILINQWDNTKEKVIIILHEVKGVRRLVQEIIPKKEDK